MFVQEFAIGEDAQFPIALVLGRGPNGQERVFRGGNFGFPFEGRWGFRCERAGHEDIVAALVFRKFDRGFGVDLPFRVPERD